MPWGRSGCVTAERSNDMPWYGSHAYLQDYIRKNNSKRIMEIGVYTGGNAVSMVQTALENARLPQEVEYYGFDYFSSSSSEQVGRRLRALGCTYRLFEGDTLETLPVSVESLPKMDLIFIDGGKSFTEAVSDWESCQLLLHDGTGVFVHNVEFPGVRRMIDQIRRDKYRVRLFQAPSEGKVALITKSQADEVTRSTDT
jgi:predicted O-methyltransferase YrrM